MSALIIENSTSATIYVDPDLSASCEPEENHYLASSPTFSVGADLAEPEVSPEIIHQNTLSSDLRTSVLYFVKNLKNQKIKNSDDLEILKQLDKVIKSNSLPDLINFAKNYKIYNEKPPKPTLLSFIICGEKPLKPRFIKGLCRILSTMDPSELHLFQVERLAEFTKEAKSYRPGDVEQQRACNLALS